jgi:hypothetical protein
LLSWHEPSHRAILFLPMDMNFTQERAWES